MFDKLLLMANTQQLYRALFLLLVMIVAMNLGATAFFQSTPGVGLIDIAGGENLLDGRPNGYTPEMLYQMMTAYGASGIRRHLMMTTADIFFPPILAWFFTLALTYFYSRNFASPHLWKWLLLLPAICLMADYLENVMIVIVLLNFPKHFDGVAVAANLFFQLKNMAYTLTTIIVIIGWVTWLFQRRRSTHVIPH